MPGLSEQRGYGWPHQKARRAALTALQDGDLCHFCKRPMYRADASNLALDHNDTRTGYRGLTHARCNQLDGARKGGRAKGRKHHRPTPAWQSRTW